MEAASRPSKSPLPGLPARRTGGGAEKRRLTATGSGAGLGAGGDAREQSTCTAPDCGPAGFASLLTFVPTQKVTGAD